VEAQLAKETERLRVSLEEAKKERLRASEKEAEAQRLQVETAKLRTEVREIVFCELL
jgi:hypothetical protein